MGRKQLEALQKILEQQLALDRNVIGGTWEIRAWDCEDSHYYT